MSQQQQKSPPVPIKHNKIDLLKKKSILWLGNLINVRDLNKLEQRFIANS